MTDCPRAKGDDGPKVEGRTSEALTGGALEETEEARERPADGESERTKIARERAAG